MAGLRPKNIGKKLASADRKAGSEAQKIPRLGSMTVHIDDPMLSQVTSRWEVARSSVVMRRVEVIQTLDGHIREAANKGDHRKHTHNIPTAKIPQSRSFCCGESCNFLITETGSKMIAMSLTMLNAAFAYQKAVRSMHVPFSVLSKAKAIGVHWKMLDITVPVVKATMIAMET